MSPNNLEQTLSGAEAALEIAQSIRQYPREPISNILQPQHLPPFERPVDVDEQPALGGLITGLLKEHLESFYAAVLHRESAASAQLFYGPSQAVAKSIQSKSDTMFAAAQAEAAGLTQLLDALIPVVDSVDTLGFKSVPFSINRDQPVTWNDWLYIFAHNIYGEVYHQA